MSAEKFTAKQIVAALNNSKGMVYVAARQLGCTANTIYNYAKRYPAVQTAIDAQRGTMIDTAEIALWKAIQNGEGWAISLALKTIGKHRGYVERVENVNINVPPELLQKLTAAIEANGLNMSDVFEAMIKEFAHAEASTAVDTSDPR